MVRPERRTRKDIAASLLIVCAVALAAGVVWWSSDARGTVSVIAAVSPPEPPSATAVPSQLVELWSAPSATTPAPIVTDSTVVSADGTAVVGHDPWTGAELWRYQRDRALCGAVASWQSVVAVFTDDRGCSAVTALDAATGARGKQRSSDADDAVRLSADGTYVVAQGDTRLELWRSDMVRTLEYGRVSAPVNPHTQVRPDCAIHDAHSSRSRVAVIVRCPDDDGERLSLVTPAPDDDEEPQEQGSVLLTARSPESTNVQTGVSGARVVAVVADRTVVFVPGPQPVLVVFDGGAVEVGSVPVEAGFADGAVPPPALVVGSTAYWWSGEAVVALDTAAFAPKWSFPGAIGPGTVMADRYLVPVAEGIAVLDTATGDELDRIEVDRGSSGSAAVALAVIGEIVVEQRGGTIVALGAPR